MEKDKWLQRNKRQYLKDVLPLDTPFSIQIEPTRACNFCCVYCLHSTTDFNSKFENLSIESFKQFQKEVKLFPQKLKTLTFSGLGEPLLNKDLAKMIEMAKEIASEVVVITNGSLLSAKKSEELIEAGLDVLRISIQGLNAEDYFETCGVKIDFEKFLNNIKYFYENRKQCKIYIKAPDIILDSEEKKKQLNEIYGKICNDIIIQNISPIQIGVDYESLKNSYTKTVYNEEISQNSMVCPLPFYTMLISTNGQVAPCCSPIKKIGNIFEESIYEIWNGNVLKNLRIDFLNKKWQEIPICQRCNYPIYGNNEYDNIDEIALKLLEKY